MLPELLRDIDITEDTRLRIPSDVFDLMQEYQSLKAQIKPLEERVDQIKGPITKFFSSNNIKSHCGFTLQKQDKSTFNEEVLVPIVQKKAPECIKQTVDSEKLKAAVGAGKISLEDIAPAVQPNEIQFIKYVAPKIKAPKEA